MQGITNIALAVWTAGVPSGAWAHFLMGTAIEVTWYANGRDTWTLTFRGAVRRYDDA